MKMHNIRLDRVISIFISNWWDAILHYFYFSGRTSRSGFWCFAILNSLILYFLFCIDEYFHLIYRVTFHYYYCDIHLFFLIYFLLTIFPSFVLFIRRLHDINLSGLWVLLMIIPLPYLYLNFLIQIIFLVIASFPGSENNRYGIKPINQVTV